MIEYFANVLGRLIVGYLTFLIILLISLAIYWLFNDLNMMIKFLKSEIDSTFTNIVVWIPFFLSWFSSESDGKSYTYKRQSDDYNIKTSDDCTYYNPSTGLPILGNIGCTDVSGKVYGEF